MNFKAYSCLLIQQNFVHAYLHVCVYHSELTLQQKGVYHVNSSGLLFTLARAAHVASLGKSCILQLHFVSHFVLG